MKYAIQLIFMATSVLFVCGQPKGPADNILITTENKKTAVSNNEKGELQVNIAPSDFQKFKNRGWVAYKDLGAKGDGKTDDMDAIAATHAVANQFGVSVKAG